MTAFLAEALSIFEIVRHPLGASLCVLGAVFTLIGTIGVMRFPDFYTRLHAASVTDTAGASFVILGMMLMAPGWLVVAKLIAIFAFLYLTSPTSSHAIANAAHTAGLQPLIGPVGRTDHEEGAP